jgi:inosose dehydratase
MTIRFGVSPIAWINDDMPELGGDTPLETVLGDIRDIGFAGVELGGKFPKEARALKALLAGYGLDLVGGWYSAELLRRSADEEIAALQPHLALLKAMGSTVWVQAETSNAIHGVRDRPLSATPRLAPDDWRRFGQRLTEVADYIQSQGLRFAYHHHLGTVVERPHDLRSFLRHTGDSVGLTLDTGHAQLGGIDPVATLRAHPERIAHVHCKDVRSRVFAGLAQQGSSFLDGVLAGMFTVPGDGDLDYGAVMRALADIDYAGWIIVEAEQDPAKADPRAYSEIGLRTLEREAAAAGLRRAA